MYAGVLRARKRVSSAYAHAERSLMLQVSLGVQ